MKLILPNEMSNARMKVIAVFVVILYFMVPTLFLSLNDSTSMKMASGSVQSADDAAANFVRIVKDSMTTYNILNNETEFVGFFDASYTISGTNESLKSSENAIISAIREDFNKSPTIGYIKIGNVSTSSTSDSQGSTSVTLPNPFADSATINQSISQKVSNAIDSVESLNAPIIDIKCEFNMNIEDWLCDNQSLNPS